MKSKVLLIPTYYPTKTAPIVGAQVKEQSELIAHLYDLKVIYCMPGMGVKRYIFQWLFGWFLKDKGYKFCSDSILNVVIPASGVYYFNSRIFSNKFNFKLKRDAYQFVVGSFIKSGWTPELLSSRGFELGGGIALNIAEKLKIPFVHTENTAFLFDSTFSLFKLGLYKKVLNSANCIFFVSSFLLKNTLMHGFIPPTKPIVIGNPIDSEKFSVKDSQMSTSKRILITGYNSYIKDFPTFFKTLGYIKKHNEIEVKAIIAITYGTEDTVQEFLDLATVYDVLDMCEFKLKVSREEMPDLIRSCDVYVSTSILETFGIAVLESLFCGIPAVSTRNGGVEDFLTAENGLLCDIGDFESLAKSILYVLSNQHLYSPDRVRKTVLEKYGVVKFKETIHETFTNVLQKTTS